MSTQYLEGPAPASSTLSRVAFSAFVARLESVGLAATHGVWEFLMAVSEMRVRKEMLAVADGVAATQPRLAARLRRAAHEGWAQ